jgi:hypothetical protein
MTVIELIKSAKRPLFTFELLPPLKGHSIDRIYSAIDRLIEYAPAYINFTTHANEAVLVERPDGLLEKTAAEEAAGHDCSGCSGEVQVQCYRCASCTVWRISVAKRLRMCLLR